MKQRPKNSKDQMMIHESESMISSRECVEHNAKLPPTNMLSKDRPKMHGHKKDTRGMQKEDTFLPTKKVR